MLAPTVGFILRRNIVTQKYEEDSLLCPGGGVCRSLERPSSFSSISYQVVRGLKTMLWPRQRHHLVGIRDFTDVPVLSKDAADPESDRTVQVRVLT